MPIFGVSKKRNAPSLLVEVIVPQKWCQRKELCPIIGVGKKSVPLFVSVKGTVPPLLVSLERQEPLLWCPVEGFVLYQWC